MTLQSNYRIGAMILLLASAPLYAADAFGYTATSNTSYSYLNVSGTGTSALAGDDDAAVTLSLPFTFHFYGISYNSLCASSNGLISFGSCVANDFTDLDLTAQSPAGDQPLIAPYWMDLTFAQQGAGSLVYQTLGVAPNRQFVVQWNNATALNSTSPLDFEVILAETGNTITFQYQNVETGSAAVSEGKSATVGIRGASGNTNGNRTQWSFQSPVLKNSLAILFTPPTAAAPVDVSAQVSVTTSAFLYNRITRQYTGTLKITNNGSTSLAPPLTVVLTNLPAGVSATNANGTATGLGPFYNVPGTTPLAPGQSATVSLVFTNPSNGLITFVAKTYSGSF